MSGVLRVLRKDLEELGANPRILAMILVVPALILLLVGQLIVEPFETRLAVAGGDCEWLRELSHVEVQCQPDAETDPLSRLSSGDIDMLLNYDSDAARWSIHISETNPQRVPALLELARGIQLTANNDETPELYELGALGALPLRSALVYYPDTMERSLVLLPKTFSLIVCFLAFVVAAPSLIREREAHTLEVLLAAPRISGAAVLVGKTLVSVTVSLFAAMIMLVLVQTTYHLYVKADVLLFLAFLVLPVLSSTLLGLIISALARSQVQTVLAAAAYFFALILLSGFLYPVEQSAISIRIGAQLFGLTYLLDTANAWFFGAGLDAGLPLVPLVIQCSVYAGLAWLAWGYQLRRV